MSLINIIDIQVENNPDAFLSPIRMNITFECLEEIKDEIGITFLLTLFRLGVHLHWECEGRKKRYYFRFVSDGYLDTFLFFTFSSGPLEKGIMQFLLESAPPNHKDISKDDLLNITAIILSVSFKKQEFFRVGYYVYN